MIRNWGEAAAIALAASCLIIGLATPDGCAGMAKEKGASKQAAENSKQMVEVCNAVGLIRLILEREDRQRNERKRVKKNGPKPTNPQSPGPLRGGDVGDYRGNKAPAPKVDIRRLETHGG